MFGYIMDHKRCDYSREICLQVWMNYSFWRILDKVASDKAASGQSSLQDKVALDKVAS